MYGKQVPVRTFIAKSKYGEQLLLIVRRDYFCRRPRYAASITICPFHILKQCNLKQEWVMKNITTCSLRWRPMKGAMRPFAMRAAWWPPDLHGSCHPLAAQQKPQSS